MYLPWFDVLVLVQEQLAVELRSRDWYRGQVADCLVTWMPQTLAVDMHYRYRLE